MQILKLYLDFYVSNLFFDVFFYNFTKISLFCEILSTLPIKRCAKDDFLMIL